MSIIKSRDVHGTHLAREHSPALDVMNDALLRADRVIPSDPLRVGAEMFGFAADSTDARHRIHTGTVSPTVAWLDITEMVAGREIDSLEMVYDVNNNALSALAVSIVVMTINDDTVAPSDADLVAAAAWTIESPYDAASTLTVATDKRVVWSAPTHDAPAASNKRIFLKVSCTLANVGDELVIKAIKLGLTAADVSGL